MTHKAEKRCTNWSAYRPAKLAPEVDADRSERTLLVSRRIGVCGGRAGLARGLGSLGQLPRRPGSLGAVRAMPSLFNRSRKFECPGHLGVHHGGYINRKLTPIVMKLQ